MFIKTCFSVHFTLKIYSEVTAGFNSARLKILISIEILSFKCRDMGVYNKLVGGKSEISGRWGGVPPTTPPLGDTLVILTEILEHHPRFSPK